MRYHADGLAPCVVQGAAPVEVLGVACASAEALGGVVEPEPGGA